MGPFKYPKLYEGNKGFRLVRLYKGAGGLKDSPIACVFELAYLGGGRAYDAVSYVWGDLPRFMTIKIAGEPFMVSPVVADILGRLRDPHHDRLLWIDLLCIDQDNPNEKGRQVERMKQIFSEAQSVFASLGPHYYDSAPIPMGTAFNIITKSAVADSADNPLTDAEEAVLLQFLEKPWFDRVWIVQEAAVAKRLRVICGAHEMDGKCLTQIHDTLLPRIRGTRLKARLATLATFFSFIARNDAQQQSPQRPELLSLLHSFRSWKASDPRDKVYALLGLSSDGPKATQLKPDYNLPVENLYRNVAMYMMSRYDSLSVLTHSLPNVREEDERRAGSRRSSLKNITLFKGKQPRIPSWCPDWRVPHTFPISPAPIEDVQNVQTFGFDANPDSTTLTTNGVIIGTIESIFPNGVDVQVRNSSEMDIPGYVLTELSAHLKRLSADCFQSNGGCLKVGDQICVLRGTTGIAILRPRKANFVLVILEHSQFSRPSISSGNWRLHFHGLTPLGCTLWHLYRGAYYKDSKVGFISEVSPMRTFKIV